VEVTPGAELRLVLERQALPLDALVVTAARRPQRLADVPVHTELISRQELEMSGSADLAEVLVERTGIQLQGGHPTGSGIMLQGMDSRRVLVLVDGQPWIGRLSGDIDLARLPTAGVERVEIVKGPQSTLYGSEAMGGVVNVVTTSPGVDRWEAGGRLVGGSGGRLDGSLRGEWPVGPVALLAEVGHRSVDRVPGLEDRPGSGVTRLDGRAKARWSRGDLDLSASVLAVEESQRWRIGQLTQFGDNVQWTSSVAAGWSRGAHSFAPAVSVSSFDHLSRRGLGSTPPPGTGRQQLQRRSEVELIYAWVPGDRVSVDAGVEARRETLEAPDIPSGRLDLDAIEPFTQVTLRRGAVTLVPGVRMSWSQEWGTYSSPRLSAMVKAGGGWTVRGSVARGFRAPDGKELGLEFLNVGPGFAYLVRGESGAPPRDLGERHDGVGVERSPLLGAGTALPHQFRPLHRDHRSGGLLVGGPLHVRQPPCGGGAGEWRWRRGGATAPSASKGDGPFWTPWTRWGEVPSWGAPVTPAGCRSSMPTPRHCRAASPGPGRERLRWGGTGRGIP
jgi:outer membrane receptor for ferrienterochelin and colicins